MDNDPPSCFTQTALFSRWIKSAKSPAYREKKSGDETLMKDT